jgi:hypothetical protein
MLFFFPSTSSNATMPARPLTNPPLVKAPRNGKQWLPTLQTLTALAPLGAVCELVTGSIDVLTGQIICCRWGESHGMIAAVGANPTEDDLLKQCTCIDESSSIDHGL